MAILNVTGELDFDVYTFNFATLFQEFSDIIFENATSKLTLRSPSNPLSFIVISGITNYTSLNQPWDGEVTEVSYSRAEVGELSLSNFTIAAEDFRNLAQNNTRALFATVFQSNDSVNLENGTAKIELGAGNDTIFGSAYDDFIVEGAGADTVTGNGGFDTLDYSNHANATVGITATMTLGGSGSVLDPSGNVDIFSNIERITGTAWSDIFNGSSDNTTIIEWVGGNGADSFNGAVGFETINFDADKYTTSQTFLTGINYDITLGVAIDQFGSSDQFNDIEAIVATDNDDTVKGGVAPFAASLRSGNDVFNGGAGDEWINPGAGNDIVNGGLGYDTVSYNNNDTAPENSIATSPFIIGGIVVFSSATVGAVTVHDQYGDIDAMTNIEHIVGSQSNDVFLVGSAEVSFTGGKGSDTFTASSKTSATIDYSLEMQNGGTLGVNINVLTSLVIDSFGDIDRIFAISNFRGTRLADVFIGSDLVKASFFSGAGDDVISVGSLDDFIAPGAGNDVIIGGFGYDQLNYVDLELTDEQGLTINKHTINGGEIMQANGDLDQYDEIEFVFATVRDDVFNNFNFGGDNSGGNGNDVFNGGTSTTLFDIVDYNAEKYYGGWLNGVIVNLSNTAFAVSSSNILAAHSARDSYSKTDSLYEIDLIRGTGLNDIFVAGQKSIFEGGAGNDIYWLDGNDTAVEKIGAGTDLVYAKASMSLPAYVENLILLGSAKWGLGNSGNNKIVGNNLNNFISGNLGQDIFSGQAGRDTFRFDTKLSAVNRDTITDFSSTYDQFSLDKSYFSKIGNLGKLQSKAFWVGSNAHDANDRIIYNKTTGTIFYDPDGTGSAAKIHFVTLSNKAYLTYADFDIVA